MHNPDGSVTLQLAAAGASWTVSSQGRLSGQANGKTVLQGGPDLMVLAINNCCQTQLPENMPPTTPFNAPCSNWKVSSVSARTEGDLAVIDVAGAFHEATGAFQLRADDAGTLQVAYNFTWTDAAVGPRQIGLVFYAPAAQTYASWRRRGLFTTYPSTHIGRLVGE